MEEKRHSPWLLIDSVQFLPHFNRETLRKREETFKKDTKYFSPSEKDFMFNYRVENLEELLKLLKEEGINQIGEMGTMDYGNSRGSWILKETRLSCGKR